MALILRLLLIVLRVLGKWLVRLLWGQVIALFAMYGAAWVIEYYADEIKALVEDFNAKVLADLFDIEDLLLSAKETLDAAIEALTSAFRAAIEAIMSDNGAQFLQKVLAAVNLSEWFAGFVAPIARKLGETVHDAVYSGCDPVRNAFAPVLNTWNGFVSDVSALDQSIADRIGALYAAFFDAISEQATTYNNAVSGTVAALNTLADPLNTNIDAIKSHVTAQINAVSTQQGNISADIAAMKAYLEANGPTEPMTEADARAFARAATAHLTLSPIPDHLTGIDFAQFRLNAPDLSNLILDLEMPAKEDFGITLSGLLNQMADLCGMVQGFSIHLEAISAEGKIQSGFLSWLQVDAADRLKELLGIAVLEALLAKRDEILAAVDRLSTDAATHKQEKLDDIVAETRDIKQGIMDFEAETVSNLPALIQPATDRYMNEMEGQMVTVEETVLVNIDAVANTAEVDHLLESFPSDIRAHAGPNNKDSEKWTIGDMYRLLCDYFDRAARIALIVHLAEQDITGDLEKIIKLPELPAEGD